MGTIKKEMSKTLQQHRDLLKSVLLTYKSVKSFFHPHRISKCDDQNFFNMEVGLFCWKHKPATEHFSVTGFFRKGLFTCRY